MRKYQQCSVGVIDTIDDPDILFDDEGRSNYYHEYVRAQTEKVKSEEWRQTQLEHLVSQLKAAGKGSDYDCVIGVSGGVDSTYVALLTKELGLRPLAVHLDNGWNSELAVKNIESIVSKLNIDLITKVLDWKEFRDLQLAYLRASVVDIEAITDHAIFATMHQIAGKRGIKYMLSGTNCITEQTLPPQWIHSKNDHVNIKAIHREFGTTPLKTFPFMDWKVKKWYAFYPGLRYESILNLVPYDKQKVKERIINELGWRDYGGKHYESIFTRFYQGYILPTKFGIDKRKAHLSDLIYAGQITKTEALAELEQPIYAPEQLKIDREFVLKKLGLSEAEFDKLMLLPIRQHEDFEIERPLLDSYPFLRPLAGPIGIARSLLWGRSK